MKSNIRFLVSFSVEYLSYFTFTLTVYQIIFCLCVLILIPLSNETVAM